VFILTSLKAEELRKYTKPEVKPMEQRGSQVDDPPPRTHSGVGSKYINGIGKIGKDVRILLNIENVLYENEPELVTAD
jgi:chemotaxis signal transduction protein